VNFFGNPLSKEIENMAKYSKKKLTKNRPYKRLDFYQKNKRAFQI